MMDMVRRLWRLSLVGGWFAVIAIPAALAGRGGWGGVRRVTWITRLWARGLMRIIHLRLTVLGDPEAFPGGLIVSNHSSYLDVLCHASCFRIRFAPKSEIRSWPVLGPFIGFSRPLWIDRKNKRKSPEIAAEYTETLRRKIPMLVYPEGTSTSGREGMLPFKSTPFQAACEAGSAIQPVLLFYDSAPDGGNPAWFGDQKMPDHVWWVLAQRELRATLVVLPVQTVGPGDDRKTLASRMRRIMLDAYNQHCHTDFQ